MKRRHSCAIIVMAVLFLAWPASQATGQGLTWWVELATRKVMQDRAPQPVREIVLEAARNEYEPFQVVIRADGGDLNNVDAWVSDLVGPEGAVIPWYNIELYRACYVLVTDSSGTGDPDQDNGVPGNPRLPGEYVDPLIPFYDPYDPRRYAVGTPFNVAKDSLQPIFGDIYIPLDVPAGEYKGTLRITVGFVVAAEVPVTLRVWNFTLPRERRTATAYGMEPGSIIWYHGGPDGAYDDEAKEIIRTYEEVLHRFRCDTINPPFIPSPSFNFDGNGNIIPPDYSAYDAAMEPRLNGDYYDDGVGSAMINLRTFYPGGATSYYETTLTDDQYIQVTAEFARHLKEKGWWEWIYVYVHDEPSIYPGAVEAVAYDVTLMKMGDPDWETRTMATNHWMPELQYSIGIWCPITRSYDKWFSSVPEYKREDYQRLIAEGDKLWFYVVELPPYAGYNIDTIHGHEPRILKWGAWYEGARGFLYYSATHGFMTEPWSKIWDPVPMDSINGCGFLVYPGDHNGTAVAEDGSSVGSPAEVSIDGPVISHRLLMIREGLEDWDYLLLAEDLGGKAFAKAVTETIYTQFGMNPDDYDPENPPWSYDEEKIYQARSQLAQFIESGRLAGKNDDDHDDGYFGCSVNFCKPQGKVVSFLLVIILILALQLVLRINHQWIQ